MSNLTLNADTRSTVGRKVKKLRREGLLPANIYGKKFKSQAIQVNLKEKVTADVPVELVGESPAEKQGLGTVVQYIDEVEVVALPTDLPEKFEIDLSQLNNVGDAVQIKNIKVDAKKVEIKVGQDEILVKVEAKKEEVVELQTETTEGETVETAGEEALETTADENAEPKLESK